eukprot:1156206-Pelagomonas_calceolata.AAC.3
MLRESCFLAGPGLGIVIGKLILWNGPKLVVEVQISSEEFGVGISYHQITAFWQKHEGGGSLCIEDGRLDSVPQDLCHGLIVIDGVADGNPRDIG